jgi:hypothetical protein
VTDYLDRPLVYVAGPYTIPDPIENVHRSVHAAAALIDSNLVTPLVPHLTMLWNLIAPRPVEFWYAYDLSLLARCDAIFVLSGESRGVELELEFARGAGLPIFEDTELLYEWALTFRNAGPDRRPLG